MTFKPTDGKWSFVCDTFRLNGPCLDIVRSDSPDFTLYDLDSQIKNSEIAGKIRGAWEKAQKEAKEKGDNLTPGLKFKLSSDDVKPKYLFSVGPIKYPEGFISTVTLNMGLTDYGVFVGINNVSQEDSGFAELLEDRGQSLYDDKYTLLPRKIGNCAIVEGSDGKIAVIRNAKGNFEYGGWYDTPGGHAEPEKHGFETEGHFRAMEEEFGQELGGDEDKDGGKLQQKLIDSVEEMDCIGVVKNLDALGNLDMLFYLQSGLPSDVWVPNFEVSRLERLTKDELFERFKSRDLKFVPPSEALVVAYFDEVAGYSSSDLKDIPFLEGN